MTRRSRAREVALQLLFQHDLNPNLPRPAVERFAHDRLNDPDLRGFALALYDGVLAHGAEVDRRVGECAENWRLPRMPALDRNVLRLGAFELLYAADTPASVAINEAIELARRFGSADSPAFVNGVLDRLARMRSEECGTRNEAAPPPAALPPSEPAPPPAPEGAPPPEGPGPPA
jgi:transcription antitermination protein NusB